MTMFSLPRNSLTPEEDSMMHTTLYNHLPVVGRGGGVPDDCERHGTISDIIHK